MYGRGAHGTYQKEREREKKLLYICGKTIKITKKLKSDRHEIKQVSSSIQRFWFCACGKDVKNEPT